MVQTQTFSENTLALFAALEERQREEHADALIDSLPPAAETLGLVLVLADAIEEDDGHERRSSGLRWAAANGLWPNVSSKGEAWWFLDGSSDDYRPHNRLPRHFWDTCDPTATYLEKCQERSRFRVTSHESFVDTWVYFLDRFDDFRKAVPA